MLLTRLCSGRYRSHSTQCVSFVGTDYSCSCRPRYQRAKNRLHILGNNAASFHSCVVPLTSAAGFFERSHWQPCAVLAWCILTSRDRKSTRLNSSHRCISYAVFCLKKKKIYI